MKTRLLFLLPIALLLLGCSKEETPEPEKVYVLLENSVVSTTKGLGKFVFTTKYHYNEQKQLWRIDMDSAGTTFRTYRLTYNLKNQLVQTHDGHESLINDYDEQGRLVKQTRSTRPGKTGLYAYKEHMTFSYNNENQIAEAHHYTDRHGEVSLFYIWKYTYTNGNPTTIEQLFLFQGATQPYTVMLANLTYDDKKAARIPLPYVFFYGINDAPAINNTTSFTLSQHWEGYGNYTQDYTYNAEGYVTTRTTNYPTGHQTFVTYTYGYK